MPKEIELYLSHLIPLLEQRGISIYQQKDIDYGRQLKLQRQDQKATLNLYFSEKRGISKVIGAPQNSELKAELELILFAETPEITQPGLHLWHSWIGSDECGKGDYFGPLIVTAFYCKREQISTLRKIGVQDSKKLNDKRIAQIARQIYTNFPTQMATLILKAHKYNELIDKFKDQNLNLNDLLAWTHDKVITELLHKDFSCEGVLIDQFSKAQKAKARLLSKFPDLQIIERSAAERDVAVAAASILSRYQFLEARAQLDKKYQMQFPLGAGTAVVKAGQLFIDKYGFNRLAEVAKVHFKTTIKLMPMEISIES